MKGFLNLNKPSGMSSARAVAIVKNKLGIKNEKIGHTGTLDPMASGVLPIAIGRATRLFDFMLSKQKSYIAEFTFGFETDTLDTEGEIIAKSELIPNEQAVMQALDEFIGEIQQVPPLYSAKSINGQRAYKIARENKSVELKPCTVKIFEFELLSKQNNIFKFKITCGSGTYIRSLCRDLAYKLNSNATMTSLVRIKSGVFKIENSINIDDVTIQDILPCEFVLENLPSLNINMEEEKALLNGKKLQKTSLVAGEYKIYNNELIGIGLVDNNSYLKMKIWLK